MSGPKLKPGERQFTIRITVRETEESSVTVEEFGEPNRSTAQVPEGIFGVREALRVGGNLVREFYNSRQRKLLLKERAADVEQRRRARKSGPSAPPTPVVAPVPPLPPADDEGILVLTDNRQLEEVRPGDVFRMKSAEDAGEFVKVSEPAKVFELRSPGARPEPAPDEDIIPEVLIVEGQEETPLVRGLRDSLLRAKEAKNAGV